MVEEEEEELAAQAGDAGGERGGERDGAVRGGGKTRGSRCAVLWRVSWTVGRDGMTAWEG